jgi:hypothetical protein
LPSFGVLGWSPFTLWALGCLGLRLCCGLGSGLLHRELDERATELPHVSRIASDTAYRNVALTTIAVW